MRIIAEAMDKLKQCGYRNNNRSLWKARLQLIFGRGQNNAKKQGYI